MNLKHLGLCLMLGGALLSSQAMAGRSGRACPTLVQDAVEAEFGPGSAAVTRCLAKREDIKVLYQINQECKNSKCDSAYAAGNIMNAYKGYVDTHGIDPKNFEIVAVVHSAGWKLVLDNNSADPHPTATNPFQSQIQGLLDKGIKIYFCQNTARSKGVKLAHMIPGIEFVTSGVTAIADFQSIGYSYVQP